MKILILSGVFPPEIGGPARFLEKFIEDIIQAGFSVSVLTYGQKDKERSFPVYRLSKKIPYLLRSFLFLAFAFFLAVRCDLIYNQDLYGAGWTSYWIKKFLKKKLITRFVGDSAWEKAYSQGLVKENVLEFQRKKYALKIEKLKEKRKRILMASDRIIVVSNFLKEVCLALGLAESKIKVIYNSVDFVQTDLPAKKELRKNLGLSGKIVLTSARLVSWKGMDMLIEIMPELIQRHEEIKLIILGEGPKMNQLKNLVRKLDLKNRVFLLGRVSQSEVIKYLKAADLFVLNTYYEGMSHTLLEAMKVGVPIITTPAGGNLEIIKNNETGILVEYDNKKEWIKAIGFVLNHPAEAEEYVQKAKNDLKRFSWENLVKQTIQVFRSLN